MKTEKLLSLMRQCINQYDLIHEGDRIAVGVSGGKDSLALLYGLAMLRRFFPAKYELTGIYVDPGLGCDFSNVEKFCIDISVPLITVKTDIAPIVFDGRKESNPCSLCANMRRGALTNACEENGINKLALGHHKDDYLSTALLSLIYEGRFYTFAPKTTYEDRNIEIIRPLLYLSEAGIRSFAEEMKLPVTKNPCPVDHKTKRAEMTDLLHELTGRYPDFKDRLLHAVETSDIPDWVNARK